MRTFRNFLNEVSLLNEQPPPGGGLPGMPPPGGGLGSPAGLPPGGPPLGGPPMGGPGGGLPPPMPGGGGGGLPPMGGPPMGGPPGGMPGAGGVVKLPELNVWKILEKLLSGHDTKKQ